MRGAGENGREREREREQELKEQREGASDLEMMLMKSRVACISSQEKQQQCCSEKACMKREREKDGSAHDI